MNDENDQELDKRDKELTQQMKWICSAFTGVCGTFFLALLSSNKPLESKWLLSSAICFAIGLPLFAGYAWCFMSTLEARPLSKEIFKNTIKKNWFIGFLMFAFFLIILAFIFLIFHFSNLVGLFILLSIVFTYVGINEVLKKVH